MIKRKIPLILILVILLLNVSMPVLAEGISQTRPKTILIDPGHGGFDPGAVSPGGTVEKDINLIISLKLKEKLENEGYKVFLTREDDRALCENDKKIKNKKRIDLNNRCIMKNTTNCDLFISIHLNKFPEARYYGAQVWHSKNPESAKLAHILQGNFKTDLDSTNDRVEKPAKDNFKILRTYDTMPSVLIECGFLSNANEEANLKKDKYQENIAESIKKSVNMFFNSL